MSLSSEQRRAWSICAVVYLLATLVAATTVFATWVASGPLWSLFWGDIAGTVVVFIASVRFNNSSLYDPYWSVAPMIIALWLWCDAPSLYEPRLILAVCLTLLWGGRLTWNFLRGWTSLEHEDWRYRDLQQSTGKAYWLVSFLGIHLFPTALVFLGMLSVYVMAQPNTASFSIIDVAGGLIALFAIWCEATADAQLRTFRQTNTEPSRFLSTGLWAWCRHPNYFGEIMFWWGLTVMAIGASFDNWWVAVGPVAITALFNFISLRLIDDRMMQRRPQYAEHCKQVPGLLPRPPKRGV